MNQILSALLLSLVAINTVGGVIPTSSRANHGCVILQSTIYCYGGCDRNSNIGQVPIQGDLFYTLDVSKNKTVDELRSSWVLNTAGDIGSVHYFAMTAVPRLNSFVIDGGYRNVTDVSQPYTYMFNATGQGSWNADISPGDHIHVDSHTAVTSPGDMVTVYVNGGRGLEAYKTVVGLAQYPAKMAIFNSLTKAWTSSPGGVEQGTSQTRLHHKGAFGKDGTTIYYIGGIYARLNRTENVLSLTHVEMSDILTYDTANSRWGSRSAIMTGAAPTPRMDHTLTLNPSTGELILYGGTRMALSTPIDDYIYVLNTDTMEWRSLSISIPQGAAFAGPRFGHASVLVGQSYLFIIFGVDSTGFTSSDIFVLDTKNWSWMTSVPGYIVEDSNSGPNGTAPNGSGEPTNPTSGNDDSTGANNTATIVGAVVGSVAGVAIVGALIMFYFLRKRRTRSETNPGPMIQKPNSSQQFSTPTDRSEYDSLSEGPPRSLITPVPYQTQKPDGDRSARIILQPVKPDRAE